MFILQLQQTNISPETVLRGSDLEKQVDELFDTFNDIARMLGKEEVAIETDNMTKRDVKMSLEAHKVRRSLVV